MGSSQRIIYFRIFGYVATISMQVGNMVWMTFRLQGDVMLDPTISFFNSMQARYFTCWNFGLQIIYALLGLYCDIMAIKNANNKDFELPKHLRRAKDTLFAAIVWPGTLLVFSLFWTMFLYDRNLVLPAVIDRVLSKTSNHIIHTAIVPVVVWELIFQPRRVPRSHKWNLAHMTLHFILYFCVLFFTYYQHGRWLYPIFGKIYNTIYLPLFMLVVLVLMLFFYQLQWYLTRLVWADFKESKKVK